MEESIIEGRNPIIEALKADREIERLWIAKGSDTGSVKKIIGMAKEKRIPIEYVDRKILDNKSVTGASQGIIATVAAYKYSELEDILSRAREKQEDLFVLILDGIEDPHNLGAITRTAEATGVHGIIIPKRRAVGLTQTVVKASAGAIEYVPIVKVPNLVQAIKTLKDNGAWIAAADISGKDYFESNLKGSIGVVIGSEGKGISKLVLENCDFSIKIPMKGEISSLNASVAAGVIMYEVVRQRTGI